MQIYAKDEHRIFHSPVGLALPSKKERIYYELFLFHSCIALEIQHEMNKCVKQGENQKANH